MLELLGRRDGDWRKTAEGVYVCALMVAGSEKMPIYSSVGLTGLVARSGTMGRRVGGSTCVEVGLRKTAGKVLALIGFLGMSLRVVLEGL
jgi:hypothetical protein